MPESITHQGAWSVLDIAVPDGTMRVESHAHVGPDGRVELEQRAHLIPTPKPRGITELMQFARYSLNDVRSAMYIADVGTEGDRARVLKTLQILRKEPSDVG